MFYKSLVLIWILLASVLIIENMVVPFQGFIFLWVSTTWVLSMFSILIWIMIWFWVHWMMMNKDQEYDDSF